MDIAELVILAILVIILILVYNQSKGSNASSTAVAQSGPQQVFEPGKGFNVYYYPPTKEVSLAPKPGTIKLMFVSTSLPPYTTPYMIKAGTPLYICLGFVYYTENAAKVQCGASTKATWVV